MTADPAARPARPPAVPTDAAAEAGAPADAVVVRVDRARCIGSGMCALTAPGSLVLGDDGLARPVRAPRAAGADGPGEPLTEQLTEAVEYCPVEALALYSARDGRPIAPAP
ncbi:ferredoxin [Kitasatospora sp. NPDC127111]|uniref:ferredoxin n=1 Tax=Kitasatospora sp. NPDC127111 TaxID=3345363 RepID=UPI00362757E4